MKPGRNGTIHADACNMLGRLVWDENGASGEGSLLLNSRVTISIALGQKRRSRRAA